MTYSILIADDHPLFREALTYIVKSVIPNADIIEANNYSETKACLEKASFSLVFLDLNMPDSNGLTDLALIKKRHPSIPIVVVSAHEETDIIRTCFNYHASGYIIKSSAPDDIKNAINTVLAGNTFVPNGVDLS